MRVQTETESEFDLEVAEPTEDEIELRVSGRFCFPAFRRFFATIPRVLAKGRDLIVDMTRLSSIDSAGIGMLLLVETRLREKGRRLIIRSPGRHLAMLIRLARLEGRLLDAGLTRRGASRDEGAHNAPGRHRPVTGRTKGRLVRPA